MITKSAVIFGASGMVGHALLHELIRNNRYESITIFVRKPMYTRHLKVKEVVIDLYDIEKIKSLLTGDEIFCCLGTTIKKARTHEAFRKVDFELPLEIGLLAKQKGIQNLLVISSLGADPKSSNFYLKTKGEMEQALMELHLSGLKIFRPSMLLGPRSESRPAEAAGQILMNALSLLFIGPLRKYKAIPATTVALSMIKVANSSDSKITYESEEMADLVKLR